MLWFTVWSVLVVGTLVGAWFLARDLWRRSRALLAELARASDVLAELAERTQELADAAGSVRATTTIFDDPDELRARVAELRAAREGRVAARRDKHEATSAAWRANPR